MTPTVLSATVPGDPIGKGRPRFSTRGGKIRTYTPERTASWEGIAAQVLALHWRSRAPLEVPCRLRVDAVARRPQRLKHAPDGRQWRATKPDGDNVLKAVADALVKAKVVRDDVLIVEMRVRSLYAGRGESPCVEIVLEPLGAEG